jgi:hypothetical protein
MVQVGDELLEACCLFGKLVFGSKGVTVFAPLTPNRETKML